MYFIIVIVCGALIPFLFIKAKSKWIKWSPTLLFLLLTLLFGGKAIFFPAPEMAVLAEIVYFMTFGVAVIGSVIGMFIVKLINKTSE
ncbi:hypothetical protein ACFSCX_07845 [Bacillus salitolerans]|uniref:Uncharacterized protein n=1 Tax=Bacillus salitolerans TaxID=1437434 RepID=A0ABW4LMV0_9BACI